MATVTIGRLAEECLKMLSGGNIQGASNISLSEMRIAIGQVCNQLLKVEQFTVNEKMGEPIPNGTVMATYDGIVTTSTGLNRSKAILPVKPIKLRRNMGVFSVYFTDEPYKEFIPLQIGQAALLQSQSQINDLLGQIGYSNKGFDIQFTQDLKSLFPDKTISCDLLIMDISQYGDWDNLPILPEHEWQIKQEVIKLYSGVGIADLLVDASSKQQQGLPVKEQKQTS